MVLMEARSQDVEAIFVAANKQHHQQQNKKKKIKVFFLLHVFSWLYSAHCAFLEIMFNYCVVMAMCYF